MNDKLEFRFVTRTLSEDYHVFGDGGSSIFSDPIEFAPLRRKGGIMPEDGPCAVLFEDNKKIFLVVSNMQSGRKDIAGRTIRFSFCQIFQGTAQVDKEHAFTAFTHVVRRWDDVQTKVQSLFHETRREGGQGENVSFDQNCFMEWLQEWEKPVSPFEICKHGDVRPLSSVIWPLAGCLLKWERSEDDIIVCMHTIEAKLNR